MGVYLSSSVIGILNSLSPRAMAEGFNLGSQLETILAELSAGNLGIEADAADVDALALGGGHGAQDADNTSGLTFAWETFRFHNGLALVTVPGGTIALTASNTNYVEADRAGTVSANIAGFTSGRLPLWQIVAGGAAIVSVASKKPLMQLIGTGGVVGSMLSTAAKTKTLYVPLGDVSATGTWPVSVPVAGNVKRVSLVNGATAAANDTNYWTLGVVNKGQAGAGTTKIVDNTVAANSSKATGGSAITANVDRAFTLAADPADDVAANDVLEVTLTKAASATALTKAMLRIDVANEG